MALSKAAFHSNAKVKANIVLVGSVEEKRAEGSYFTLSDDHWVALGDDALDAQRKLMATNAQREFQRLSQNPKQRESPVSAVSNGRELIREEIERYLEGLVAAKRPAKSARMNRNFLNAFVDLAKKQYTDEYGRDDVIGFRNDLLSKEYEHKYIDTQMDFVLPFFKHRLKRPIVMERGDRLKVAANPPEPSRTRPRKSSRWIARRPVSTVCSSAFTVRRDVACRKSRTCAVRTSTSTPRRSSSTRSSARTARTAGRKVISGSQRPRRARGRFPSATPWSRNC